MTKKRIRQMNSALRRRLTGRPAADWLPQGESFARRLETEGYMQRFVPLFQGRFHLGGQAIGNDAANARAAQRA